MMQSIFPAYLPEYLNRLGFAGCFFLKALKLKTSFHLEKILEDNEIHTEKTCQHTR